MWIATRGLNFADPNAAICRITKAADVPRAFMSLGGPVGMHRNFAFFKSQEILALEPDPRALEEDYIEIALHIFDNGDDKVWVEG